MKHQHKPNFLVIGASRSGTTTIHSALEAHPQILVPAEKSPNYFTAEDLRALPNSEALIAMKGHTIQSSDQYQRIFIGSNNFLIRGEVSPVYLQSVYTPGRVYRELPDARIIAILRNPIDRAYAHYLGRRRDGLDKRINFADTIAEELAQPTAKPLAFNNYLAIGRYAHYLKPWYNYFSKEKILILFFDDFLVDPQAELARLYSFLGANSGVPQPPVEKKNVSGIPTQPLLRALWTSSVGVRGSLRPYLPKRLRDIVGRLFLRQLERPPLPEGLRPRMADYYSSDIRELAQLTGRSLIGWLS
ncbi:MAG: sulfotransferase [Cyanobacteria bacterium]|nr:sulfotransferase [Cyanobacteriota bacterium]MDA0886774.1 sulfotransferase [Cyanobacteriota bacterium]